MKIISFAWTTPALPANVGNPICLGRAEHTRLLTPRLDDLLQRQ